MSQTDRTKDLSDNAQRKVLAEKRAYEIVKMLLEKNISKEFFTNSVLYISNQHYEDVIEERTILKLCGYSLCDNLLINVPKQQYKISGNKVYDLTDRKKFCSNSCFKASEHVKQQISTSPLWLRNRKNMQPIHLDQSNAGLKGKEIPIRHTINSSDIDATNEDNLPGLDADSLNEYGDGMDRDAFDNPHDVPTKTPKTTHQVNSAANIISRSNLLLQHIFMTINEWLGEESVLFLKGPSGVKNELEKHSLLTSEERRIEEKMKLLDKRIMQVNVGHTSVDPTKVNVPQKNDETAVYTERVERFLCGRIGHRPKVTFKDLPKHKVGDSPESTKKAELPSLDTKDQMVIRRRILHKNLSKIMHDLVPTLPNAVLSQTLKDLISTFRLTSHNVMIKTNEVPIVAVTLLYLLCENNREIKDSMEQSHGVIEALFTSLCLDRNACKEFAERILH